MKPHRPTLDGIREVDPKAGAVGRILLTQRASPTVRTVQGWLMPLEHYDEAGELSPLHQYLELLLMMAAKRPVDVASMQTVLRQARNSLDDEQFDRLLAYRVMFDVGHTVLRS